MSEVIIPRLAIQRAIEALTHVKARADDRTERQHQRDIDELRALLAASPADQVASAARELISQIEKAEPVDDHGHRLRMNAAFIKLKELL